ncbi:beta-1,3-galactosyltransferase 5 [Tribolium madens]|uniref:beta-1,3-galactosyltransferase 5 n=1 Tax=Tribolium madens TaxID=41895 RepID=UPI001CF73359|nr:beta-1,3-galactosyltransferase 5 [Tribolium madens]
MVFVTSYIKRPHLILIGAALAVLLLFSLNGIKLRPDELELGLEPDTETAWKPPSQLISVKHDVRAKIFNLTLKYILTPAPCLNFETLAVIIVTSHHNNVETRSAMRRAIPREELTKLGLKRTFLVGESPDNIYMNQAALVDENHRFGDIIQGNFIEDYRNLTFKHLMGLKWVSENCQNTQYVIKMDDDIVINVGSTVQLLRNLTLPADSIAGYVLRDMTPKRDPSNKWYVTSEEYHFAKYPSFVSGWFYITRVGVASRLVLLSHYFKFFWIDDVYVTGILAKNLRLRLIDLKRYFTVFPEFLQCCITDVKRNLECNILVGPNGGDSNLFFEFNEAMKLCGKCGKRDKPINETCVAERKINLGRGNVVIQNYSLH